MLKKLVEVNAGGGGDHWDEFWYEKAQSDKAGVTIDIIKTIGYWWTNPGSGPYSRDTALAQWRAETNMETNQSGQNGQKRKADEIATPCSHPDHRRSHQQCRRRYQHLGGCRGGWH